LQSVPQPALLGVREGTRLSVLLLSVALQASSKINFEGFLRLVRFGQSKKIV